MTLTQLLILSLVVLLTATALRGISKRKNLLAKDKESQSKHLDPARAPASPWQRIVTSAAGIAIAVSALIIAICAGLYADSFFRHQALSMRPHTARILGYQVTFPKEIPEGYEGGTITLDYSNDMEGNKQGKQGRTRLAEVYDIADELDAEKKSSNEPGNEEKFLPPHGATISALEYLAHEDGKLIGLRGYGYSDENAAILLTDSVLNSFHKGKMAPAAAAKGKDSTGVGADGTVVIGHTGDAGKFTDPYAELIKP